MEDGLDGVVLYLSSIRSCNMQVFFTHTSRDRNPGKPNS